HPDSPQSDAARPGRWGLRPGVGYGADAVGAAEGVVAVRLHRRFVHDRDAAVGATQVTLVAHRLRVGAGAALLHCVGAVVAAERQPPVDHARGRVHDRRVAVGAALIGDVHRSPPRLTAAVAAPPYPATEAAPIARRGSFGPAARSAARMA